MFKQYVSGRGGVLFEDKKKLSQIKARRNLYGDFLISLRSFSRNRIIIRFKESDTSSHILQEASNVKYNNLASSSGSSSEERE